MRRNQIDDTGKCTMLDWSGAKLIGIYIISLPLRVIGFLGYLFILCIAGPLVVMVGDGTWQELVDEIFSLTCRAFSWKREGT